MDGEIKRPRMGLATAFFSEPLGCRIGFKPVVVTPSHGICFCFGYSSRFASAAADKNASAANDARISRWIPLSIEQVTVCLSTSLRELLPRWRLLVLLWSISSHPISASGSMITTVWVSRGY